jgi:hypothetical protein
MDVEKLIDEEKGMDFTIYALKSHPDRDWCNRLFTSLKNGEGRFGWSYIESADLRELKQRIAEKGWDSLSKDEKACYQSFLLDFKPGDYVVYINLPNWGKCTLAKVTGQYQWKFEDQDFNHRFPVDPSTVQVFDRNDASVHPALRSRLKLQGRWWRINLQDEFSYLLEALRTGTTPEQRKPGANLQFLANEIQPHLLNITRQIHHTHPNYDLEHLFGEVFKKVPGVINVKCQGGAGDHGADILVTLTEGFPISGLQRESVLVVQVKSYEGGHLDTRAVEDIKRAFEYFPEASMGLIVSTADSISQPFEDALYKLREESGKPVALLVWPDVAAFLLRYGENLLSQQ